MGVSLLLSGVCVRVGSDRQKFDDNNAMNICPS